MRHYGRINKNISRIRCNCKVSRNQHFAIQQRLLLRILLHTAEASGGTVGSYSLTGYVSEYDYTPDNTLNIKQFATTDDEWLDFVINCRSGKKHSFDIVEGQMTDDTIYNYLQDYLEGNISRPAFFELAKFKKPTHQISFHTAGALATLKFIKATEKKINFDNNLFYTCSLIEYIGRQQKLERQDVVKYLGDERLRLNYSRADVLHCEPIEKNTYIFSKMSNIAEGHFDNIGTCKYTPPSYWDIGKVYCRLITDVSTGDTIKSLVEVKRAYTAE